MEKWLLEIKPESQSVLGGAQGRKETPPAAGTNHSRGGCREAKPLQVGRRRGFLQVQGMAFPDYTPSSGIRKLC